MTKVLFVVGSLRKGSFNHQLAEKAEKALEGKAEIAYLDWSQIPAFSEDAEVPTPASVQAARDAVEAADAIWFFSPVYNYAIPGSLKNVIDWLSRALDLSNPKGPSILENKFTTVSAAANGGQEQMFAHFADLLPFVRTQMVGDFTAVAINPEAWVTGELLVTDDKLVAIAAQAEALINAIKQI